MSGAPLFGFPSKSGDSGSVSISVGLITERDASPIQLAKSDGGESFRMRIEVWPVEIDALKKR